VVVVPRIALRASPEQGRDATTQAMRDIGEELQRSPCPAPPQPIGTPGFAAEGRCRCRLV